MKRIFVLFLLMCIPATTFAADPFKDIVRAMEHEYGVHHSGLPWFARAFMKPALWRSGVSGLKVANFENVSFSIGTPQLRIADCIERTIGPEWQNVVRVHSRHDNEITYIYMRPNGPRFTMLVVSVESHEATVVQMTLKLEELAKWVDDKDRDARAWKQAHRHSSAPETAALISSDTPGGYSLIVP